MNYLGVKASNKGSPKGQSPFARYPLVVIVGPTAVGKSELAIYLAQIFDGEIVSADSRQVYMDIGTAKPGLEERAAVPHHLIDQVDPDQDFSLALYKKLALHIIEDIQGRGKLALLVGGSGLYVWSVVEGWAIAQVPPDPEFRRSLEERAAREGSLALYHELQQVDPVGAEKIDSSNARRVIRALEVCRGAGGSLSQLLRKEPPWFDTFLVGLTAERGEIYRRIDSRVDDMVKCGLVDEVQGLIDRGYGLELSSMSGIGYRQIGEFLQGELDLATAIQRTKYETHRVARHQYAWFRLKDERIHWFDITRNIQEPIGRMIGDWLDGRKI
ncbi:tRNA (adenosine(37)-N6)-dimethylallyltransferase MiaA [Chloroflexota bacterium]